MVDLGVVACDGYGTFSEVGVGERPYPVSGASSMMSSTQDHKKGGSVFFLLVPVFAALAVLVVIGPALLPGVALFGIGWLGHHLMVRHRQHDQSVPTH